MAATRSPTPWLLVPTMAVVALLVGLAGDARRESTLILLLEPVLWLGTVWGVYAFMSTKRPATAAAFATGALIAALVVRLPGAGELEVAEPPVILDQLRGCARSLPLPERGVRLAEWHVRDNANPEVADQLLGSSPDLVVLSGAPSEQLAELLAEEMGGEILTLSTPEGTATFVSRGVFNRCGDDDGWTDAPAAGAGSALVFAALPEGVVFPLVLAQLPSPLDEPRWGLAARNGRGRLAALAGGLESSLLVVIVDAVTPGVSRHLEGALLAAGLRQSARLPNWPTKLLGIPWPAPLFAFDQVWAADGWISTGARTLRIAGEPRRGLVVDLVPAGMTGLPTP